MVEGAALVIGAVLARDNLTLCYGPLGGAYELPPYVLCLPDEGLVDEPPGSGLDH